MFKNIVNVPLILCLGFLLTSCSSSNLKSQPQSNQREYQIGAYLWFQHSGEYKALSYQAYNLAREKVLRDLENKHNRKRAVIFDIDETILDNSFGGAREIKDGEAWHEGQFAKWVALKKAVAIPGALSFIKFLEERQVEIFYVTNRKVAMFDDTYDNLVKEGFPVKKSNLLMMDKDRSKEPRRLEVAKKHEIILLVGDNLSDHHKDFDVRDNAARNAAVETHKNLFGDKFIVLPNPLYGDWERAMPYDKPRVDLLKVEP